jgi:hypothetical protein
MKLVSLLFAALLLALPTVTPAGTIGDAVSVEIVTDSGRQLPLYPAPSRGSARKVYAEAVKGDHYRIVVHNRLPRRVGLVIAVDGRNIITGKKSWLAATERMYILEPYGAGEYSGWRTGDTRINRFFFTEAANSYAAAFRDESAMGVIAVAAYPEVMPVQESRVSEQAIFDNAPRSRAAAPAAPAAEAAGSAAAPVFKAKKAERAAGTGYGREEYSPVVTVAFEPEQRPSEKILIKYEWRTTLCRQGIIPCEPARSPRNRLWDNDGYAPPPPGRG